MAANTGGMGLLEGPRPSQVNLGKGYFPQKEGALPFIGISWMRNSTPTVVENTMDGIDAFAVAYEKGHDSGMSMAILSALETLHRRSGGRGEIRVYSSHGKNGSYFLAEAEGQGFTRGSVDALTRDELRALFGEGRTPRTDAEKLERIAQAGLHAAPANVFYGSERPGIYIEIMKKAA